MTADPADLANLRDIALPAVAAYWPPPAGWWIVGAALLAAALLVLARGLARYRHNAYRRAALRELAAIGGVLDPAAASRVSAVLKRVALVTFPREQVAALSGEAWLAFLDRTGRTGDFRLGPARALPALALNRASTADGEAIVAAARRWVRRHRADSGDP
jgi:Domain of unknown function (DUF4381)